MFDKRIDEPESWDAYSPYELRNVGALVRLGQRDEALQVLDCMISATSGRRRGTSGQEIVWRDATGAEVHRRHAAHLGRRRASSTRCARMFAYEREEDQALVLAAGVPRGWITDGKRMAVRRLPTYYGVLSYSLESAATDSLRMQLSGDVRLPPGNLVLRPPLERPLQCVRVNGKPIQTFSADEAVVSELPATVEFDSTPPPPTPTPTRPPPATKRPAKKAKPPKAATATPRSSARKAGS